MRAGPGGTANDSLDGGEGNDILDGGAGRDQIDGGGGTNQVAADADDGALTVSEDNNIDLQATFVAGVSMAVIDWGDGTVEDGTVDTNTVSGTHAYLAQGEYEVTITADTGETKTIAVTVTELIAANGEVLVNPIGVVRTGGTSDNNNLVITTNPNGTYLEIILDGEVVSDTIPMSDVTEIRAWGHAGDDKMQVSGSIDVPVWLYGQDGNDKLRGGGGNDVLIGGPGDDLLVGKSGQDYLEGGMGADRIVGNADDDILIAGISHFASPAIRGIMERWTADGDAVARRDAVEQYMETYRVENDLSVLIEDDDECDVLTGSSGTDWFFANFDGDGVLDKVTDLDDELLASDLDFILAG